MRLGIYIHNYRMEHGISMDAFAKRSGVSKSYIGFIENGKHPKTGKKITPSVEIIAKIAAAMNMDFDTLFHMIDETVTVSNDESRMFITENRSSSVRIPVLGSVTPNIPIDDNEDIKGYVEISEDMALQGEFYALEISDSTNEPYLYAGDVIIVHKTKKAASGDVIVAFTSETDSVCKKYIEDKTSKILKSFNSNIKDIDVTKRSDFEIIGYVVELRRKLNLHI